MTIPTTLQEATKNWMISTLRQHDSEWPEIETMSFNVSSDAAFSIGQVRR